MRIVSALCCGALIFSSLPGSAQGGSGGKAQQLKALFTEEWEYELRSSPETATQLGDNRYNDRLDDYSPEFVQSDMTERRKFLARFTAFDPAGLIEHAAL